MPLSTNCFSLSKSCAADYSIPAPAGMPRSVAPVNKRTLATEPRFRPVKHTAKSEQILAKRGERSGFAELNVRAQNPMSGEKEALLQNGASAHIIVVATHPVFTPEANGNLNHPAIREIVVTDSIPVSNWPRVETASLAPNARSGDPPLHSRGINGEFIPGSHSW